MLESDYLFKARIVQMILMKENFEAIKSLSSHYGVKEPYLKVGMPKGCRKNAGCYVPKTKTIHVMNQYFDNPFVILHEFYHHLRTQVMEHRGSEKYADKFVKEYIQAFQTLQEKSQR